MSVERVVVEADGGSRGNPGNAGYGAAVLDTDGTVLITRHGALGITTNNVAEYRGLIAGLSAAHELGARTVDVRMDSKLVVEQMCGRWKIKNATLQPLAARARELRDRFDAVTFNWIPRASNTIADGLANEAMDGYANGTLQPEEQAKADKPTPAEPGTERKAGFDVPASATTAPAAVWSGATGNALRLILLRHGQTEFSVRRKYSGRGNPPLTDVGLQQAAAAAQRLGGVTDPAAVISSPLSRASQTAQAVAASTGVDMEKAEALVELDFGSWEGLSFSEVSKNDPELHRAWLTDPSVRAPGGESFDQVHARVAAFKDELVQRFAGRTVILVSHVTPIKTLLRIGLDAGPSVLYRIHLDLASISTVDFYADGNSSVSLVNDTSHLH